MLIGKRNFELESGNTYVMGILNVTPDSFSDGGKYNERDAALRHVEQMINEGADIIDIGGESTRPGYQKVSESEEIDRVCEVLTAIKERFDVPVSIDSYKAHVMKACDIWGLRYEIYNTENGSVNAASDYEHVSSMAKVVAEAGVPVVLMHNDDIPRSADERRSLNLNSETLESQIVSRVSEGLMESVDIALEYGIKKENIIIDPGVGFAKTQRENLMVLNNMKKIIKNVGYPMLLGASRKSVIGDALKLPKDQREEGTLVTTVMAVVSGCSFVRVHDVEKNVRAIKMAKAIIEA